MTPLKTAASLACVAQIALFTYIFGTAGRGFDEAENLINILIFIAAPILGILAIWLKVDDKLATIKRKRRILEEQEKVHELEEKLK